MSFGLNPKIIAGARETGLDRQTGSLMSDSLIAPTERADTHHQNNRIRKYRFKFEGFNDIIIEGNIPPDTAVTEIENYNLVRT